MPELIQNGPKIPVELLNLRDDGKVVFFCGSGISVSTGLPMFDGLVSQIYERTAQAKLELEQDLCEKGQLDKVLGLLENRLNDGVLRREAISILTVQPPENSLVAHKALIDLSRHSGSSIRLVTTNFDDRFELADPDILFDAAPKLPLPKPHGWGSVVYLHGRITDTDPNGQSLVLTAADFGRAYLTERWASRFITELFREFTIVFVGYSLNDPVMSYMVDALAAERQRGARFQKAYAFADFKDGEEGRRRADLAWQGKNVMPILFDAHDGFAKLTDTLVRWADISRDPINLRRKIVFDELRKLPSNAQDPVAQRVTWALSDKPTAKALAEAEVITDENDFPILAGWLDVFDEAGLLSRPVDKLADGSVNRVPIVAGPFTQYENAALDDISTQLALWLAKHLHVPQVLGWAARKGGCLHPFFRDQVRRHLSQKRGGENDPPELPDRLRLLWTVLTQNTPIDHREDLWWEGLIVNAASDAERKLLGHAIVETSKPHLIVVPGPSRHLSFRKLYDDDTAPLTFLEDCAHLKLVTDGEHWRRARFDRSPHKEEFLANHALEITEQLRHAMQLLPLDEVGFSIPSFYRPAIEEHEQNRDRDDWTFLIDWARDGYFAVAARNSSHANLVLNLWLESEIPLFHRLVLHVLTEDPNADIHAATNLLLAGAPQNVWSDELYHEVMVFLRKAGQRLPAEDLNQLVKVIRNGPPLDESGEGNEQRRARKINLRLSKLASSGAELDFETRQIADAYKQPQDEAPDVDEFLSWIGKAQWVEPHDHVRSDWQDAPSIDQLTNQVREGEIDEEKFAGIYMTWPIRALRVLRNLADKGNWPAKYWHSLLWSTSALRREGKIQPRTLFYLGRLLLKAPDILYLKNSSAISSYIEDFSKECLVKEEDAFRELWNKAWRAVADESSVDTDDVLTQALNSAAGRLAEAAVNRLWKYQPEVGRGLPEPVLAYFDSIVALKVGRFGRVILASKLSNLFAIAPDWTKTSLLPRMHWHTSDEARELWAAYAWAASAGPNLLAAFKTDFITALENYSELGDQRSNLVYLFVAASLDPSKIIKSEDIRLVVDSLPEDGLIDIAALFKDRLGDNIEKQADIWKNICFPWLQACWPKAQARNTTKTSIGLVECLIKTGDAFPEALVWAEQSLRPGTEHVLWQIQGSGIHQKWPIDTLKMLAIMIPDNNIENWNKHTLQEMLNEMKEAEKTLVENQQYQRLYDLAI